jgi:hypothetical protein
MEMDMVISAPTMLEMQAEKGKHDAYYYYYYSTTTTITTYCFYHYLLVCMYLPLSALPPVHAPEPPQNHDRNHDDRIREDVLVRSP